MKKAQKMNENNNLEPTCSQDNLPKKIEIDTKSAKWFPKPSSPSKIKATKSKTTKKIKCLKTPEKQNKIDKYFTENMNGSPTIRRKNTNSKMIRKHKYLSPSAKMDPKIPKVEDLLRDREKTEKLKEIDMLIKQSSTQFLKELKKSNTYEDNEKPKFNAIDCKHLTLKQIERRFRKDVDYLDGIFSGTVYSKRHELFCKQLVCGNRALEDDLRVSESFGVFTSDQLVHIVSLFRERYDNGNKYKNSDYYFKVLLPDYCLKLFMVCHKMSNNDALEYLKNVPVPNLFGLV